MKIVLNLCFPSFLLTLIKPYRAPKPTLVKGLSIVSIGLSENRATLRVLGVYRV